MEKKLIAGLWLGILLLFVTPLYGQSDGQPVSARYQLIDGRTLTGEDRKH